MQGVNATKGTMTLISYPTILKASWPIIPGGQMPHEESGSTSNFYYSFEVHIIMLGSYTDFDVDSNRYKWLEADLAQVDRKKTPWILVLLHAPWYNTNTAHQGEGESMRQAMELWKSCIMLA
jgi:hypothetical protein